MISKAKFLKYVSGHKMVIQQDNGVYRHLRFAGEQGWGWFNIITWPWNLAIVGDMGNFIFNRLEDMFQFFPVNGEPNLGYWAEKVTAEDRGYGGVKTFSVDLFREAVIDTVKSQLEITDGRKIPKDIREEIQPLLELDNEIDCMSAIYGFSSEKIAFGEFYENHLEEYTPRYVWCCHAIQWAIQQYKQAKPEASR